MDAGSNPASRSLRVWKAFEGTSARRSSASRRAFGEGEGGMREAEHCNSRRAVWFRGRGNREREREREGEREEGRQGEDGVSLLLQGPSSWIIGSGSGPGVPGLMGLPGHCSPFGSGWVHVRCPAAKAGVRCWGTSGIPGRRGGPAPRVVGAFAGG